MSLRPIVFACGHQLVDNGVGDYMTVCPKGCAPSTVFLDQAMKLVADSVSFWCGGCGETLGACTDRGVFGGAP